MKKTLLIILPLLLIVGCSKPVDFETITVRNNLAYLSQETKPYTGSVYKNSGEKEILKGTYKDGFEVGMWTYKTLTGSGIYDVYYNIGKVDSILFYESDSASLLNKYIDYDQDVYFITLGQIRPNWVKYHFKKINLKAVSALAFKNFSALFENNSLKNGNYFYQNTSEYNFFNYPDIYAEVNENDLHGGYYEWENGKSKLSGFYYNGKRYGIWENRAFSEDSISVWMHRLKTTDDDGDEVHQEKILLHKNLEPIANFLYQGNRPAIAEGFWGNTKNSAYKGGYTYGRESQIASYEGDGIMTINTSFGTSYSLDGTWSFYRPNGIEWVKGKYVGGEKWKTWEYYDKDGNVVKTEECEINADGLVGSQYGHIWKSDCDDEIISNDQTIKMNPTQYIQREYKKYEIPNTDFFYFPEKWYGAYFE